MKTWLDFAKTCVVGGFFGILPIVLVLLLVIQAVQILGQLAAPIADLLPVEQLGGFEIAQIVALILMLSACFVAGLVLRTRIGSWTTDLVESSVLNKLPGYGLLRTLTQRIGGFEEGTLVAPALADLHGTDARALVFIVEEHDDGYFTILVPNAPTPTVGTLYIIPAARVTHVEAKPVTIANCFMQWGIGSKQLLTARG